MPGYGHDDNSLFSHDGAGQLAGSESFTVVTRTTYNKDQSAGVEKQYPYPCDSPHAVINIPI